MALFPKWYLLCDQTNGSNSLEAMWSWAIVKVSALVDEYTEGFLSRHLSRNSLKLLRAIHI